MFEDAAFLAEIAGTDILDLVQDQAPDLGADHVLLTRPAGERCTHADLGETCAIEGRGVEIADAVVPGGIHRREGFLLRDVTKHVAERRRTEAQSSRQNILESHAAYPSLVTDGTIVGDRGNVDLDDHTFGLRHIDPAGLPFDGASMAHPAIAVFPIPAR